REVVVERLMIKKGIEKRLEASIEQAIKLAKGIVLVAVVDGEERLYSEKMACVDCAVSVPAIEPRTFSFNSIYGACEVCNGLGVKFDFDPARIIADRARPLLEGGLASTNTWLDAEVEGQVRRVAEQLGANLSTPFEQLPAKTQHALFYGIREKGKHVEGVIECLSRHYDQESPIAEDLAAFMVTKLCGA